MVRQDENWSLCENGTPPGPGQMSGSKINVNYPGIVSGVPTINLWNTEIYHLSIKKLARL